MPALFTKRSILPSSFSVSNNAFSISTKFVTSIFLKLKSLELISFKADSTAISSISQMITFPPD